MWSNLLLVQVKRSLDRVNEVWSSKRCVIYTPTVEAGVNFDREHFDSMFVYLSQGSTQYLGLMQMTGRVRKLRSNVVYCVAKGLQPDCNDAPPVLPKEMVDHFTWVDRSCFPDATVAGFAYKTVPLPDGRTQLVPELTPQLVVVSHNFARAENSQHCFMSQLHTLLLHAGHKVGTWQPTDEEASAASKLSKAAAAQRTHMLLKAAPISWDTAQVYRLDVISNQATAEQKWALERYHYFLAWGIHNVRWRDGTFKDFLEAHSTDGKAYKLKVCAAIFKLPELHTEQAAGSHLANTRSPYKLAAHLRKLLEAVGISNPFDPERTECKVTPEVAERLRQCEVFQSTKSFKDAARLFDIKVQAEHLDFTQTGTLTRYFIRFFSKAGLCVEVPRHGSPTRGNRASYLSFPDDGQNQRMADLLKVQVAKQPGVFTPSFVAFMRQHQLQHYVQLCGPVLARLEGRLAVQERGDSDGSSTESSGGSSSDEDLSP
jgi:hypothetical protein